jgi:Lrp/AsnC family leucine-responsive transcriptional regulator
MLRSAVLVLRERKQRYLVVTCETRSVSQAKLCFGKVREGSRHAGAGFGGIAGGGALRGYLIGVEEINRTIISLLARDGRMSFTELAKRTGLSVSAAQQRVRRLERRGAIRGYAAIIDPEDAGLPLTAFVSIKPFDPAAPDDAPERLAHLTAIEACHSVAGEENYILKVRVATPAELENLLQEIRTAASVSTRTTVVLSTPYENRPPLV